MNRSRPAVRQAIKFIHDGGLGKVYMARGLCFKPRPADRQVPGRSDGARREIRAERQGDAEPTYDAAYLAKVDYDLWLGPAPKQPFNRNRFHYNWHWHWDYGNGDTGNQGPHQFDIARWGLGKQEHPVKISSVGGYFGTRVLSGNARHPDVALRVRRRHVLEFGTRGQFTNDEGGVQIGNLFYGPKGWLWIDETAAVAVVLAVRKNEKGPGSDRPPRAARQRR